MTTTLEDAIAQLKQHPASPVVARVDDLEVELRVVGRVRAGRAGDLLASLGPWEGESPETLLARLREARDGGGSAEPPAL